MRRIEKEFTVAFDEVDASGWFYGAVYFKYVNELLFSLLNEIEYPMPLMLKRGFSIPPVKYEIEFYKPAKYGDVIIGEMEVVKVGNSSIHLEFVFKDKERDKVYAKGYTVRVFTDSKKEKSVNIPEDIRARLLALHL
ncbi:MAG TPA: acyl-CoA thioesterase [Candidatus Caldiarchaeum subterraneum]|uniref:Acyl-CoA thioesterase n=1 Tax=Caldiarchaeum subterraneum TaxID=311458 RepID=A0A832ZXG2_CALS0|nr:acyl-CoA thioesterase [Candidatus Caldarchaeum subterraneum]